jgi:hypothetical protein
MVNELATAIMDKYKSSADLRALLAGGMYFQQAPQAVAYPYADILLASIGLEQWLGGRDDCLRTAQLQFDVYDNATDGGERAILISEIMGRTYDFSLMNMNGWHIVSMRPISTGPLLCVDEIWQNTLTYELSFVKE